MKKFVNFWLCLSFLAFLAGCAVNPVTGRNELALMNVTTQQEVELGSKSYSQALQQMGGVYPDQQLAAYVDRVGQRLARNSHRPELTYHFNVVNDSTPNAFALPGGFIAITRGLLVNMDNEAQLAAVLGHEIGHVTARHSVQELQRSTLLGTTVSLLGGLAGDSGYGTILTQVGGLTANLLSKRYSREQEFEADRLGIGYMARADYGLQGAVQLQNIFVQKLDSGSSNDWVSGLFRTHPVSRDRLQANRQLIATEFPQYHSSYGLSGDSYRRYTASLQQTKAAYATFDQARQQEAQGQLEAAIESYHKAIQQAPDQGLLLSALGMAYLRKEDIIPARRYLLKAVNVQGDYFQSHLGLGYIYLRSKEFDAAATQLESSLDLLSTLQGTFLLAETEEGRHNPARARQLYQAVQQADSNGQLGQEAAARLRNLSR